MKKLTLFSMLSVVMVLALGRGAGPQPAAAAPPAVLPGCVAVCLGTGAEYSTLRQCHASCVGSCDVICS